MMLRFDKRDPYPMFESLSLTLAEAKSHSQEVDHWIGLNIEKVENELTLRGCRQKASGATSEKQNLWIGLAAQNLLTPYVEIRRLLENLGPKPDSRIVDLGAGYGRMGFVIGRHFQNVKYVGYEYVGERVAEGRRCLQKFNYPNVHLEHQDLLSSSFKMMRANYYFIYDYGSPKAVEKTLYDLRRIAADSAIVVIGRGRAREAIAWRHSWLKSKYEIGYSSIYENC